MSTSPSFFRPMLRLTSPRRFYLRSRRAAVFAGAQSLLAASTSLPRLIITRCPGRLFPYFSPPRGATMLSQRKDAQLQVPVSRPLSDFRFVNSLSPPGVVERFSLLNALFNLRRMSGTGLRTCLTPSFFPSSPLPTASVGWYLFF